MRKCLFCLLIIAFAIPSTITAQIETQTFTSESGALTFEYPADWTLDEAAGMAFGTTSNGLQLMLYTPSFLESIMFANSNQPVTNATDVVNSFLNVPGAQPTELVGEIELLTVGDFPAAMAVVSTSGFESLMFVVQVAPTEFVMIYGQGAELEPNKAAFIAIGESMSYTAGGDIGEELEVEADITIGEFPAPVTGTGEVIWQVQTLANGGANQFDVAKALDVDSQDMIYVADGDNGLLVFNADGVLVNTFFTNLWMQYTADVSFQEDWDRFYFADQGRNSIVISRAIYIETNEVHMNDYTREGLGAYPWGNLSPYTIDTGTNDWLYTYDLNVDESGNPLGKIVVHSRYADDGQSGFMFSYDLPADFAAGAMVEMAPENHLLVANTERILIYDAEGSLLVENFASDILAGATIQAITADQQSNIYVATSEKLLKLDSTGALVQEMGLPYYADMYSPIPAGQFHRINDLVILSNGDVVIADSNESYIQLVRMRFN